MGVSVAVPKQPSRQNAEWNTLCAAFKPHDRVKHGILGSFRLSQVKLKVRRIVATEVSRVRIAFLPLEFRRQ